MKNELTSMRSNFDLNPFSGKARPTIQASRKDFDVYRFYQGQNFGRRWHIRAEKSDKYENFEKIQFLSSRASILLCQCFSVIYLYLK